MTKNHPERSRDNVLRYSGAECPTGCTASGLGRVARRRGKAIIVVALVCPVSKRSACRVAWSEDPVGLSVHLYRREPTAVMCTPPLITDRTVGGRSHRPAAATCTSLPALPGRSWRAGWPCPATRRSTPGPVLATDPWAAHWLPWAAHGLGALAGVLASFGQHT